MLSNHMLDLAHEISNKFRMDDEWHMKLIRLLEAADNTAHTEGYREGYASGIDAAAEAVGTLYRG